MSAAEQIAALRTAYAIPARVFAGEDKDPAVALWNRRQGALAAIELQCRFYSASEAQIELLAEAEDALDDTTPAQSLQGVLAKMWVALSHSGGAVKCENDRAESDAIRRADTAEVAAFIKNWDAEAQYLFSAICDLERIIGEAL